MIIKHLDSIFCETNQPSLLRVPELGYTKSYWRRVEYHQEECQYDAYLVDRHGLFLSGFLPLILEYCKKKKIAVETEPFVAEIKPDKVSDQIKLWDNQKPIVYKALSTNRGIIQSPTGSGKTIMAAAICSAFPNSKILFLCHTIDLLSQTKEKFSNLGLADCTLFYGKEKNLTGKIVISTIQSFAKFDRHDETYNMFDVVIVDEAHMVSSMIKRVAGKDKPSTYYHVLTSLITQYRYGLTATPNNKEQDPEGYYSGMGLIGPIITETSLKEAQEQNVLSSVKVKLVPVPKIDLREHSGYQAKYQAGIVEYRLRNRMVIKEAKTLAEKNLSSLIYVDKIEHGNKLMEIAERMQFPVDFVRGATTKEERENLRHRLNTKEIKTVIATVVWTAGIDIPELDCIIFAAGNKKEQPVLQKIGRGMRRTANKDTMLLVDFIDQGRYLSEHFTGRLTIYVENNWI